MLLKVSFLFLIFVICNEMKSYARPILSLEDYPKLAGRDFCNDGKKKLAKMCKNLAELEEITGYKENKMKQAAEKCQNGNLFLMREDGLGGGQVSDTVLRCAYFFEDKDRQTVAFAIGRGISEKDVWVYEPGKNGFWVPSSSKPGFF